MEEAYYILNYTVNRRNIIIVPFACTWNYWDSNTGKLKPISFPALLFLNKMQLQTTIQNFRTSTQNKLSQGV